MRTLRPYSVHMVRIFRRYSVHMYTLSVEVRTIRPYAGRRIDFVSKIEQFFCERNFCERNCYVFFLKWKKKTKISLDLK